MLKKLVDFFLTRPKRLVALEQVLTSISSVLVVLGATAHGATKSLSLVSGIAGGRHTAPTLANLLLALPTRRVPESAIGFGLVTSLILAEVVALRAGRMYDRVRRY